MLLNLVFIFCIRIYTSVCPASFENHTGKIIQTQYMLYKNVWCYASLQQMYNLFPKLMDHLPGPHHKVFAEYEEARKFIKMKIQEHKDTLDPSSPRDYIDSFLIRINQVGKLKHNI